MNVSLLRRFCNNNSLSQFTKLNIRKSLVGCRYMMQSGKHGNINKKLVLVYINESEQVLQIKTWSRLAVAAAAGSFGACAVVLWQRKPLGEKTYNVFSGTFGKIYANMQVAMNKVIPFVAVAAIIATYYLVSFQLRHIIKKILLSKDMKTVTIVNHSIFGKSRAMTVPMDDIKFLENSIKIPGHRTAYYISESGKIVNRQMFDSAARKAKNSSTNNNNDS